MKTYLIKVFLDGIKIQFTLESEPISVTEMLHQKVLDFLGKTSKEQLEKMISPKQISNFFYITYEEVNVTSLSQSLLAKKIDLESQWNKSYLEQGKLTTDMQWLDVMLKEVKRQILQQDLEAARQENNLVLSEEEDPAFIAS